MVTVATTDILDIICIYVFSMILTKIPIISLCFIHLQFFYNVHGQCSLRDTTCNFICKLDDCRSSKGQSCFFLIRDLCWIQVRNKMTQEQTEPFARSFQSLSHGKNSPPLRERTNSSSINKISPLMNTVCTFTYWFYPPICFKLSQVVASLQAL